MNNCFKKKGKKKYINSTLWNIADRVIRVGDGFVLSAILARYLGTEGFGIYNFILSLVALLEVVSKFGMETIAIKNYSIICDKKNYTIALNCVSFIGIFVSMVCLVCLKYRYSSFSLIIIIAMAIYVLSTEGEIYRYYLFSQYNTKKYTIVKDFVLIAVLTINIAGVVSQQNLEFYIVTRLFSDAIMLLIPYFFVRKYKTLWDNLTDKKVIVSYIKKTISTCFPLILSGLSVYAYMKIDQVMIGDMLSKSELGIYSAVVKVAESWYFLPTVICSSLIPVFAKQYTENKERFWEKYSLFNDFLTCGAVLIAIIISLFSKQVMILVFGKEYVAGSTALLFYSWSGIFVCFGCVRSIYISIMEYTKFSFAASATSAIVNIVLNYILIPRMGIMGAVIATVICYGLQTIGFNLLFRKMHKVGKIQLISLFRPVVIPYLLTRKEHNNQ